MKKLPALILTAVIASIAICALASPQSSAKRRTPALTNDDLDAASASAPLPSESEVRLSVKERAALSGAIAWQRDLHRAGEAARAEGKLIVADVYTDWCGWCRKMDETIYSDPAIVALSRQQVFVKVNAEDRGEGQRFAQQMGVRGYPTTIVLDAQGKVLNITRGYIASPRAFGKLVQEALAQAK
jgi:thiol:disulfide interchange protein